MTGFSADKLASLQESSVDYAPSPSPLSPLSLYPTPLEQFTHHWDVVEVRSLLSCNYSKPLLLTDAAANPKHLKVSLVEMETRRGKQGIVSKIEKCWYSGHSCVLLVPPPHPSLSYRAQRVKVLSWHCG